MDYEISTLLYTTYDDYEFWMEAESIFYID